VIVQQDLALSSFAHSRAFWMSVGNRFAKGGTSGHACWASQPAAREMVGGSTNHPAKQAGGPSRIL
jgi:hypothetical protein